MIDHINTIRQQVTQQINTTQSVSDLEQIKVGYLSKKGPLREFSNQLKSITDPTERKKVGQALNNTVNKLKDLYQQKFEELQQKHIQHLLHKDWLDVTMPGTPPIVGHLHPITQLQEEAEDIFLRMGFEIVEPRLIDSDFHVFEALNIPIGHPARDMWDTFWTEQGHIPITHTSAMQHRILSTQQAPIRAIVPGRCFRHEATDATHEHTFYQIEGVYVDKEITVTDLIGTLKTFLSSFYQRDVRLRIQPSYFPFVEPGLEIMIDCAICGGNEGVACSTCRNKRWIELVPAGMIHPKVLTMAGIDPNEYQGFAWGMGLDRLVMIKYGIEDLRWFHSGDLRFLEQF